MGRLAAIGPGVVRFVNRAVIAELAGRDDTIGLAVRALADLHYRVLALDLDLGRGAKGAIRIRLQGSNPKVLDGHPFVFNIKLETDFERLAALVLGGMETGKAIMRSQVAPLVR